MNDPITCPTLERARQLAAAWAAGHAQWPRPAAHPELLVWARAFMMDNWGGELIGSALTTGTDMAWAMGARLEILGAVRPVGVHGVLPLCEAAGWPQRPGPGDEPLPPLR